MAELKTFPPEVVFLASRPLGDELELLFQVMKGEHFRHIVRRTVLGIGFPSSADYGQMNPAYVCVAAERVWHSEVDDSPSERQYIIIDEAECMLTSQLVEHCIRLKDTYLCSAAFCANDPVGLVNSLKRAEGLSNYSDEPSEILRQRHPSFVSTLYRASVQDVKVDLEAARKDINGFLDAQLQFPGTGIPIYGNADEPQRKLITLDSGANFHTDLADQAVQRSEPKYIIPVWLAVNGLDRSFARSRAGGRRSHEWSGATHSGY